jgi:tRNA pseudouridine38-40 synthase
VQLPSRRRFAAHAAGPFDLPAMRAGAALYLGRHDFAAVRSAGGNVKTTVRTVSRSEIRTESVEAGAGPAIVYEVEADGFLRKMVRSLVGGLLALGRGTVTLADLRRALEAGERSGWPAPAPACGLTLVRVDYPPYDERVLT